MTTNGHDHSVRHLFDELRQRRAARSSERALRRELATYTSDSEVNDLMALVSSQETADAELIRTILLDNRAA